MRIGKFKEKWENLRMENKLLKASILILVIGFLIEGAMVIYINKSSRTIIVPAYLDRQFYVSGDKASPEYIEMMTKYAVELLSNYTPETVEERVGEFLRFIEPSYYHQLAVELQALAKEEKGYGVSQFFIPQRLILEGNSVAVIGIAKRFIQDKEVKTASVKYRIGFEINKGRYEIVSYERVEN